MPYLLWQKKKNVEQQQQQQPAMQNRAFNAAAPQYEIEAHGMNRSINVLQNSFLHHIRAVYKTELLRLPYMKLVRGASQDYCLHSSVD